MGTDTQEASESVSVVVPVFNEVDSIAEIVDDLLTITDLTPGSEIVAVDDGSSDGTGDILRSIAERDRRVRVLSCPRNRGHGPALITGIRAASRPWLFLVDADGQIKAAEFAELWERRARADLIMGSRTGRVDRRHRLVLSRAIQVLASRLGGSELVDPNVPFKLVRRALWDDLRAYIPEAASTPSLLLAVGAALRRWRIETVPVRHTPRSERRSKLRIGRLARLSLSALVELNSFRRRVRRAPARADEERRSELPATSEK